MKDVLDEFVIFGDFSSNPKLEDICKGVKFYKESGCTDILSVGGGSTIDVAKCIKLWANSDEPGNLSDGEYGYNRIKHIAVPTTAGTGSEATSFAVIYNHGEKLSVDHGSLLPDVAVLDAALLNDLPEYHKKSSLLDAMCQAIESFWSRRACDESKEYSVKALQAIMSNKDAYLCGDGEAAKEIMLAAYFAGKAINLSKTTAPHAMSYKLTSLYGLAHGHAVALCLIPCWKMLSKYAEDNKEIFDRLTDLAQVLGCESIKESIDKVGAVIEEMSLPGISYGDDELRKLAAGVNSERLGNNPVIFNENELVGIYESVRRDKMI